MRHAFPSCHSWCARLNIRAPSRTYTTEPTLRRISISTRHPQLIRSVSKESRSFVVVAVAVRPALSVWLLAGSVALAPQSDVLDVLRAIPYLTSPSLPSPSLTYPGSRFLKSVPYRTVPYPARQPQSVMSNHEEKRQRPESHAQLTSHHILPSPRGLFSRLTLSVQFVSRMVDRQPWLCAISPDTTQTPTRWGRGSPPHPPALVQPVVSSVAPVISDVCEKVRGVHF